MTFEEWHEKQIRVNNFDFCSGYEYAKRAFNEGREELKVEIQEKLKADLIADLKERMQYSTSPSCTKGMELFIKSIEKWKFNEDMTKENNNLTE